MMSTDVLPATQPPTPPPEPGDRREPPQGRWWKGGLLAIGVVAVAATAVAVIPGAGSSPEIGLAPTHTIARGDVIVSITEQGTLESSENTEIKCKVRGQSTVVWVIEGGTEVEPGDELVRLDTLALDDAIAERTKYAHLTRSGAERARATVAHAELAIPEYLEGRYQRELIGLETELAIAESVLRTAQSFLAHNQMMAERGYVSQLTLDQSEIRVTQAELNLAVIKTRIRVLQDYRKQMELEELQGNLRASKAELAAEEERSQMDAERRDLAIKELEYCVIKAERSGLVIYPSAARWKNAPEIEEGATVHMDQVLLLMPDLSKMQVKVGVHESIVERMKPGLAARVTLPDRTLAGEVSYVAPVTRPAGWWTGNVVKYDTIIKLPPMEGLKPGMSAEVEVVMDRHEDVLTIPVTAVVETAEGDFCWLKTDEGARRRALQLGDTDGHFLVVEAGVEEGDEVVLDPIAHIEAAQVEALKPMQETTHQEWDAGASGTEAGQPASPGG